MSTESAPALARAGVMEGRHVIKGGGTAGTLQATLAHVLSLAEWVQADSLKTIENTAVPVITLSTKPLGGGAGGAGTVVRLDVTFEGANHRGVEAVALTRQLAAAFPELKALFLVLKSLLSARGLDNPYTGGLTSFGLILLLTRFLQHHAEERRHAGDTADPADGGGAGAGEPSLGELLAGGPLSSPSQKVFHVSACRPPMSDLQLPTASRSPVPRPLLRPHPRGAAGFLDYFGNFFNPRSTGISVEPRAAGAGGRAPARTLAGRFLPRDQASIHEPLEPLASAARAARPRHAPPPGRRLSVEDAPPLPLTADKLERRFHLDPLYVENPLVPHHNVTRNCFRIYRPDPPPASAARASPPAALPPGAAAGADRE